MKAFRGIGIAFGSFAASFALHIVGGATGQGWLFAIAVALIFVTATAFPTIALVSGGFTSLDAVGARATGAVSAVAGYSFTLAALWAANGRAFAWWEFPTAAGLLLAVNALTLLGLRAWRDRPDGSMSNSTDAAGHRA